MVFQKGLCELRVRLCTQLNPTFDCWTHSFPFPPKSTWKQQQNRKNMAELKLLWIIFHTKTKNVDIFSYLYKMFPRRQNETSKCTCQERPRKWRTRFTDLLQDKLHWLIHLLNHWSTSYNVQITVLASASWIWGQSFLTVLSRVCPHQSAVE